MQFSEGKVRMAKLRKRLILMTFAQIKSKQLEPIPEQNLGEITIF